MRIRSKLFVGFGVLLIVLFALAGIGINRLSMTDRNLKDVYENRYQKLKISTALRNDSVDHGLQRYVVRMNRNGKLREADDLRTSAGNALQDQFIQSIAGISAYHEKALEEAVGRSLDENNRAFTFTGILTIIGLLLGFAIIYWIGTAFTRGLKLPQKLMMAFAGRQWGGLLLPCEGYF